MFLITNQERKRLAICWIFEFYLKTRVWLFETHFGGVGLPGGSGGRIVPCVLPQLGLVTTGKHRCRSCSTGVFPLRLLSNDRKKVFPSPLSPRSHVTEQRDHRLSKSLFCFLGTFIFIPRPRIALGRCSGTLCP